MLIFFSGAREGPSFERAFTQNVPSGFSVARASAGRFVGPDGLIGVAADGVARFDCDPLTHEPRGLLLEAQRTNSVLHSGDISAASWVTYTATIEGNAALAPDGTMTATRITTTANMGGRYTTPSQAVVSGSPQTSSVFMRYVSGASPVLRLGVASKTAFGNVGGDRYLDFNAQTGAFVGKSAEVTDYEIEAYADGWWRISGIFVPSSSAASALACYATMAGTVFDVWGAQRELGFGVSSYIPTNGAAVTRAADSLTLAAASWFRGLEGTVLVDCEEKPNKLPSGQSLLAVFGALGSAGPGGIGLINSGYLGGNLIGQIWNAGSMATQRDSTILASGRLRAALRYKSGMPRVAVNGVLSGASSAMVPVLSAPQLVLSGHVLRLKRFRYWPRAMSNLEMQKVTQ